ncbi:MAG TPA: hypothetical protein VHX38_11970 [Pseudonocardiaceae bacterium]|nr:hypothetical protein [Pseudonocardiaceae bacterium]
MVIAHPETIDLGVGGASVPRGWDVLLPAGTSVSGITAGTLRLVQEAVDRLPAESGPGIGGWLITIIGFGPEGMERIRHVSQLLNLATHVTIRSDLRSAVAVKGMWAARSTASPQQQQERRAELAPRKMVITVAPNTAGLLDVVHDVRDRDTVRDGESETSRLLDIGIPVEWGRYVAASVAGFVAELADLFVDTYGAVTTDTRLLVTASGTVIHDSHRSAHQARDQVVEELTAQLAARFPHIAEQLVWIAPALVGARTAPASFDGDERVVITDILGFYRFARWSVVEDVAIAAVPARGAGARAWTVVFAEDRGPSQVVLDPYRFTAVLTELWTITDQHVVEVTGYGPDAAVRARELLTELRQWAFPQHSRWPNHIRATVRAVDETRSLVAYLPAHRQLGIRIGPAVRRQSGPVRRPVGPAVDRPTDPAPTNAVGLAVEHRTPDMRPDTARTVSPDRDVEMGSDPGPIIAIPDHAIEDLLFHPRTPGRPTSAGTPLIGNDLFGDDAFNDGGLGTGGPVGQSTQETFDDLMEWFGSPGFDSLSGLLDEGSMLFQDPGVDVAGRSGLSWSDLGGEGVPWLLDSDAWDIAVAAVGRRHRPLPVDRTSLSLEQEARVSQHQQAVSLVAFEAHRDLASGVDVDTVRSRADQSARDLAQAWGTARTADDMPFGQGRGGKRQRAGNDSDKGVGAGSSKRARRDEVGGSVTELPVPLHSHNESFVIRLEDDGEGHQVAAVGRRQLSEATRFMATTIREGVHRRMWITGADQHRIDIVAETLLEMLMEAETGADENWLAGLVETQVDPPREHVTVHIGIPVGATFGADGTQASIVITNEEQFQRFVSGFGSSGLYVGLDLRHIADWIVRQRVSSPQLLRVSGQDETERGYAAGVARSLEAYLPSTVVGRRVTVEGPSDDNPMGSGQSAVDSPGVGSSQDARDKGKQRGKQTTVRLELVPHSSPSTAHGVAAHAEESAEEPLEVLPSGLEISPRTEKTYSGVREVQLPSGWDILLPAGISVSDITAGMFKKVREVLNSLPSGSDRGIPRWRVTISAYAEDAMERAERVERLLDLDAHISTNAVERRMFDLRGKWAAPSKAPEDEQRRHQDALAPRKMLITISPITDTPLEVLPSGLEVSPRTEKTYSGVGDVRLPSGWDVLLPAGISTSTITAHMLEQVQEVVDRLLAGSNPNIPRWLVNVTGFGPRGKERAEHVAGLLNSGRHVMIRSETRSTRAVGGKWNAPRTATQQQKDTRRTELTPRKMLIIITLQEPSTTTAAAPGSSTGLPSELVVNPRPDKTYPDMGNVRLPSGWDILLPAGTAVSDITAEMFRQVREVVNSLPPGADPDIPRWRVTISGYAKDGTKRAAHVAELLDPNYSHVSINASGRQLADLRGEWAVPSTATEEEKEDHRNELTLRRILITIAPIRRGGLEVVHHAEEVHNASDRDTVRIRLGETEIHRPVDLRMDPVSLAPELEPDWEGYIAAQVAGFVDELADLFVDTHGAVTTYARLLVTTRGTWSDHFQDRARLAREWVVQELTEQLAARFPDIADQLAWIAPALVGGRSAPPSFVGDERFVITEVQGFYRFTRWSIAEDAEIEAARISGADASAWTVVFPEGRGPSDTFLNEDRFTAVLTELLTITDQHGGRSWVVDVIGYGPGAADRARDMLSELRRWAFPDSSDWPDHIRPKLKAQGETPPLIELPAHRQLRIRVVPVTRHQPRSARGQADPAVDRRTGHAPTTTTDLSAEHHTPDAVLDAAPAVSPDRDAGMGSGEGPVVAVRNEVLDSLFAGAAASRDVSDVVVDAAPVVSPGRDVGVGSGEGPIVAVSNAVLDDLFTRPTTTSSLIPVHTPPVGEDGQSDDDISDDDLTGGESDTVEPVDVEMDSTPTAAQREASPLSRTPAPEPARQSTQELFDEFTEWLHEPPVAESSSEPGTAPLSGLELMARTLLENSGAWDAMTNSPLTDSADPDNIDPMMLGEIRRIADLLRSGETAEAQIRAHRVFTAYLMYTNRDVLNAFLNQHGATAMPHRLDQGTPDAAEQTNSSDAGTRGGTWVRSAEDLSRLADMVAADEDSDPQLCVRQLIQMRDALYSSGTGRYTGVLVGASVDETSIGSDGARGQIVPGGTWVRVAGWPAVEAALEQARPGSSAFVLWQRPDGVGHAVLLYRTADRGVVAVEPQRRPNDRVVPVGSLSARVTIRAVVVNPDGVVMTDVLPPASEAESAVASLLDPPRGNVYGMLGREGGHDDNDEDRPQPGPAEDNDSTVESDGPELAALSASNTENIGRILNIARVFVAAFVNSNHKNPTIMEVGAHLRSGVSGPKVVGGTNAINEIVRNALGIEKKRVVDLSASNPGHRARILAIVQGFVAEYRPKNNGKKPGILDVVAYLRRRDRPGLSVWGDEKVLHEIVRDALEVKKRVADLSASNPGHRARILAIVEIFVAEYRAKNNGKRPNSILQVAAYLRSGDSGWKVLGENKALNEIVGSVLWSEKPGGSELSDMPAAGDLVGLEVDGRKRKAERSAAVDEVGGAPSEGGDVSNAGELSRGVKRVRLEEWAEGWEPIEFDWRPTDLQRGALAQRGLEEVDTTPNGDCLFEAVFVTRYGRRPSLDEVGGLRQATVRHLRQHEQYYSQYYVGGLLAYRRALDELARARVYRIELADFAPVGLAVVLGLRLTVLDEYGNPMGGVRPYYGPEIGFPVTLLRLPGQDGDTGGGHYLGTRPTEAGVDMLGVGVAGVRMLDVDMPDTGPLPDERSLRPYGMLRNEGDQDDNDEDRSQPRSADDNDSTVGGQTPAVLSASYPKHRDVILNIVRDFVAELKRKGGNPNLAQCVNHMLSCSGPSIQGSTAVLYEIAREVLGKEKRPKLVGLSGSNPADKAAILDIARSVIKDFRTDNKGKYPSVSQVVNELRRWDRLGPSVTGKGRTLDAIASEALRATLLPSQDEDTGGVSLGPHEMVSEPAVGSSAGSVEDRSQPTLADDDEQAIEADGQESATLSGSNPAHREAILGIVKAFVAERVEGNRKLTVSDGVKYLRSGERRGPSVTGESEVLRDILRGALGKKKRAVAELSASNPADRNAILDIVRGFMAERVERNLELSVNSVVKYLRSGDRGGPSVMGEEGALHGIVWEVLESVSEGVADVDMPGVDVHGVRTLDVDMSDTGQLSDERSLRPEGMVSEPTAGLSAGSDAARGEVSAMSGPVSRDPVVRWVNQAWIDERLSDEAYADEDVWIAGYRGPRRLEPMPGMDDAFPWRSPRDPLYRVYEPYAAEDGSVHPEVLRRVDEVSATMVRGRDRLRGIADDPADPRLRRGALATVVPELERNVAAEIQRLIRGDPLPSPRVRPAVLTEQHFREPVREHERPLIGQWGLFLHESPQNLSAEDRPAVADGRILGVFMGAVLDDQGALETWERTYASFPNYLLEIAVEGRGSTARRVSTMSADGAANSMAFVNTAVTPSVRLSRTRRSRPNLDQNRINAIITYFDIQIPDRYGEIRSQLVAVFVALDNTFGPENNPDGMIIADYGEGYLSAFDQPVATDPPVKIEEE